MSSDIRSLSLTPALLQGLEKNAVRFAQGAGAVLLGHFETALKVEYKSRGGRDPVTAADRESEEYLRREIVRTYPAHGILGEEGKDLEGKDPDFLWVLDPLDGTTNFVNGLPFFAVSVGVLFRGEPVAAAIFVPTSGLLQEGVFHARSGGPACLNDTPIQVSINPMPEPSQLTSLPAHYWRQMRFSGEIRRAPGEVRALGSIALELALTACGTLQYAVFDYPKIWDVAAGVLLVKQAGGLVLHQQGRGRPWLPLERFEPRPGAKSALEGYHQWSGTVVVGNPEIAWSVATSFHRPSSLFRPLRRILRRVRQLPLWRSSPAPQGPQVEESAGGAHDRHPPS